MIAGRRVAWFNCFSGISGDMTLGSLVDAGADTDELVKLLGQIPIGGWSLEFEPVLRHGLAATQAIVSALDDGVVRTFMHVLGIVEEARLPDRVRARAVAAFSVLAEVEGRLHRRPVAQVHFHEVGGHDAIVDVVGSAIALELLEVDIVASSPVVNGTGVVRTSHGLLPNPAPAVVELLAGIPTVGRDVNVGAGTITCNYDGASKHRTVIEDDVHIGSGTQLVAPVTIGRGATIGAGTTVWKDAPPEALTVNGKTQIARADWKRPKKG